MADSYTQLVTLNGGTASVIQSLNQYTVGLTGGYLIDRLFDMVPVEPGNIWGRTVRQLAQVAVGGLLISTALNYIHGDPPPRDYRDPTGGYFLLVGYVQGQPGFMRNGKEILSGLSETLDEMMEARWGNPTSPGTDEQED